MPHTNIIEFFWRVTLHFSPEDFKNRIGIAKNLQNENTRPINSVDLAYMLVFMKTIFFYFQHDISMRTQKVGNYAKNPRTVPRLLPQTHCSELFQN
jgi:hypothetical protein